MKIVKSQVRWEDVEYEIPNQRKLSDLNDILVNFKTLLHFMSEIYFWMCAKALMIGANDGTLKHLRLVVVQKARK